MVLGKELARVSEANPRYKAFFVDYDKLKKTADSGDAATLMALLQRELSQVNDIADVEWEALVSQLKTWLNKAEAKGVMDDVQSLDNLTKALLQLHEFSEINYTCFRKIMNRCGERQSTSSCTWFMERIDNSPFRVRNWDIALAQLGQLYAMWREKSKGAPTPGAAFTVGECSAEAFLVPMANVMQVKVALLKQLRPASKQVRIPTTSNMRSTESTYDFKQALCHVYLDSARGDQYRERYKRRVEGRTESARGALLQCRLATGDGHADPNTEVHLDVEDSEGVKAECVLPQKAMASLMNGSILPDKYPGCAKALESAATVIKDCELRPCVSVNFSRSSFGGDGGEVLVALDEDIFFRDEAASDAKAWCPSASKAGNKERQVAFVGGLLRVWYAPGVRAQCFDPTAYGIEAEDLQLVPGFSEALHGMALIHREVASPLPPWIPAEALPAPTFTSTLLQPRTVEPSVAPPSKKPDQKAAAVKAALNEANDVVNTRCWEVCLGKYQPEKEMLVDCKTPLSIERTLLRWLRSTVILGSLSAFLVSSPSFGNQINGVLLGLVSLIFVVMPLKSFIRSSLQLMNPKSKQPKVDRVMPWIMASSLGAVLAATLVVDISGYGSA